jgi:hypothetical protein
MSLKESLSTKKRLVVVIHCKYTYESTTLVNCTFLCKSVQAAKVLSSSNRGRLLGQAGSIDDLKMTNTLRLHKSLVLELSQLRDVQAESAPTPSVYKQR